MKRKLLFIFSVIILLLSSVFILPKHIGRYFYWNYADIRDHMKFPKLDVNKGDQTYHFIKSYRNFPFEVPFSYYQEAAPSAFEAFLSDHETVAFLVLKNDVLIYENYFAGFDSTSIIPSFSVSKVFLSALVGIAIDEGYIYSTSQSITFFLKELPKEFDAVTIDDLLNMRSGIDFDEAYNTPFADMAKYYYGTDLMKYITQLKIKEPPGINYDYVSVNSLLLGLIVERATNTKLSHYLEKKIWVPLGMESDASWSIDNEEDQTIKAFCCINAIARDFLKFGSLYLNHGRLNEKQIIPEKWIIKSTSIINDSRDSQGYSYTYQWRVLENGTFFAKGILGQYIFVYPEKNMVFVRLGESYADVNWAEFFLELSDQI
ncbi:MAG: beta-lactamase family protein [Bacteroidales bacterium]|nr:beta-lactamase family protein [Bacteroidales bacterium]MCF8403385.1 beta-lactamase family protein [Bacteroidales bacterium]